MSSELTAQAEQLLADAGLDAPGTQLPAVQQSADRTIAILADIENGDSYTAIARKHGVAPSTVSRIAAKAESFSAAARNYLRAREFRAIDAWTAALDSAAKRGDHRPAKDLLLHTGLIEPLADTSASARTQIAIVIGEPGKPVRVSDSTDEG